jgi:hypothetical protein
MWPNKRLVPSHNGEAPLFAAQPRRWAQKLEKRIASRTCVNVCSEIRSKNVRSRS